MKPGPFENVKYIDSKTNFRVESILDKKRGDFSSDGYTAVLDGKNKELWRHSFFTGRKTIELSPDGLKLALIGNFYFGNLIMPSESEEIVEIYHKKKKVKVIRLGDVFKAGASQKAKPTFDQIIEPLIKNVESYGGGWMSMDNLIKVVAIDWSTNVVTIKSTDEKEHQFAF